jgi:hypothetical protein
MKDSNERNEVIGEGIIKDSNERNEENEKVYA